MKSKKGGERELRNLKNFDKLTASPFSTYKSLHDIPAVDIDGKPIKKLGDILKGKKLILVVNVASKCGLTKKNYTMLHDVYRKYKTQGLEILAFPCNQFGG